MDVLKSFFVCVLLIGAVVLCIICIIGCVRRYKDGILRFLHVLAAVCAISLTTLFFMCFGEYTYPFEQKLNPILIAEFDVPAGCELEYPGQKFWHGAYEAFGLYAESFYFNPDNKNSMYGFGWPPMDFERYCYIITYGQKIYSLSYNVWETIDEPIRTGAKVGHMTLCDEFMPEKVYIYQIPKIRIENDINDVNRPWD